MKQQFRFDIEQGNSYMLLRYIVVHIGLLSALLRVDVSKDQRSGGQSSKFDFAYTLYIGRPRYYTYEIKVYLAKYCLISNKI